MALSEEQQETIRLARKWGDKKSSIPELLEIIDSLCASQIVWHSVEEKPEKSGDYLAIYNSPFTNIEEMGFCHFDGHGFGADILAWSELPAFPKEFTQKEK